MTTGWRLPAETGYLAFNERPVLITRYHPIVAVLPFVKLVLFSYAAVLVMGLYGTLGTFALLAVLIQTLRMRGHEFGLGFLRTALSFLQTVAIFIGLIILLGFFDNPETVVYIVILGGLLYSVYNLIEYFLQSVFITDRRVFEVSGIITRTVATMPLRALTDIRYDQTLPGRFLGYGHFTVESAGQDQALSELRFVNAPQRFYKIIMEEALGGELPPEFFIQQG